MEGVENEPAAVDDGKAPIDDPMDAPAADEPDEARPIAKPAGAKPAAADVVTRPSRRVAAP